MDRGQSVRKLGTALHISTRGMLIIRGTKALPLKTPVFTKTNQQIGFIRDVFGPVSYPYIAVSVKNKRHAQSLIGSMLYYTTNRRSRRKTRPRFTK
ncbi:MAG: H/ACA ribonucleoprotein complex subunit GAR1 [Candidatus Ranarchaeia archaeon]